MYLKCLLEGGMISGKILWVHVGYFRVTFLLRVDIFGVTSPTYTVFLEDENEMKIITKYMKYITG